MLEKARAKNKKPKSSAGISSMPNITVGTQVCDTFIHKGSYVMCCEILLGQQLMSKYVVTCFGGMYWDFWGVFKLSVSSDYICMPPQFPQGCRMI